MDTNFSLGEIGKTLERLNIGRSFRAFGGLGLLITLWTYKEVPLKIALITFLFGAIARIIEMLNKIWPHNTLLQVFLWTIFLLAYFILINNQIQLVGISCV